MIPTGQLFVELYRTAETMIEIPDMKISRDLVLASIKAVDSTPTTTRFWASAHLPEYSRMGIRPVVSFMDQSSQLIYDELNTDLNIATQILLEQHNSTMGNMSPAPEVGNLILKEWTAEEVLEEIRTLELLTNSGNNEFCEFKVRKNDNIYLL